MAWACDSDSEDEVELAELSQTAVMVCNAPQSDVTRNTPLTDRRKFLLGRIPSQVVLLPANQVRALESRMSHVEEDRQQALRAASARALQEKVDRQLQIEAQLRTYILLEKVSKGELDELEPLLSLQPQCYVMQPREQDAAGEMLHKLVDVPPSPVIGECTKFLLKIGANRTLKDKKGLTAFDKACKSKSHGDFVQAVNEHVAAARCHLRHRMRRVFIVAYRFHEVLQEVALRPGYSGFKRCRESFEMHAALQV